MSLRRIAVAAEAGHFDDAAAGLADYRSRLAAAMPLLKAAEPSSLFNPAVHNAHFAALHQLYQQAIDPLEKKLRIDRD